MSDPSSELRLGKKALEKGFLTPVQLQRVLIDYDRLVKRDGPAAPSLSMILLKCGFVNPAQMAELMSDAPPAPREAGTPALRRDAPAPPPSRFGKYELKGELGRGSMGIVVEAWDTIAGRRVALKRPFARSPRGTLNRLEEDRFFVEAQLAQLIPKHPHLVQVLESGKIDGQCYLAMEFVEGRSMSEWRKTSKLREEIAVFLQVAAAIHHAHEHGVIHRDLKPANIMIRDDGSAVVTDFGVAKASTGGLSLTPVGFVIGSPGYMSPEQARGMKKIDRTTDVYSLGVILYEILTGRRPFEGRSAMEILLRMTQDPIRRPSEIMRGGLNPVLYQDLETICLKALSKIPRDRQATARALAEDVARCVGRRSGEAESDPCLEPAQSICSQ